jgi:hypothetical protein
MITNSQPKITKMEAVIKYEVCPKKFLDWLNFKKIHTRKIIVQVLINSLLNVKLNTAEQVLALITLRQLKLSAVWCTFQI